MKAFRVTLLALLAAGDRSVFAFTVDGGRITAIDVVRNPEKLARLPELHTVSLREGFKA